MRRSKTSRNGDWAEVGTALIHFDMKRAWNGWSLTLLATIALVIAFAAPGHGVEKRITRPNAANIPLPVLAPWHKPRKPAKNERPARKANLQKPKKTLPKTKPNKEKAPISVTKEDPPPPVDEWSETDVQADLLRCVAKLAAIQAKVEVAKPFRKGRCGAPAAVAVKKIGSRFPIAMAPAATLRCKMAVSLYRFIEESLQPAAVEILGSPIVSFRGISTYSCRNRYGRKTGRLSEHALANALDVGYFRLANGKSVSVLKDWGPTKRDLEAPKDAPEGKEQPKLVKAVKRWPVLRQPKPRNTRQARQIPPVPIKKSQALRQKRVTKVAVKRAPPSPKPKPVKKAAAKPQKLKPSPPTKKSIFLKRVHAEACRYFGTVLGPEANEAHRDHFHFDMAPRKRSNYCE